MADDQSRTDAAVLTEADRARPAAVDAAASVKPYRGLVPFTEREAEFFFGRERERQLITSNLRASRLTLLYGASGVGKTSVLKAGVVHHLRRIARKSWQEQGNPKVVAIEFASWAGDPVSEFPAAVEASVRAILADATPAASMGSGHLDEVLHAWAERLDCTLLVILDQFDEYFLYHADEAGEGAFAADLPRALRRRDLRANFLISIREDAYSKLDRFKDEIRNLYGNYLRIEHLDRTGARDAIVKPLEKYNSLQPPGTPPVSIEPDLVEAVLDAVAAGQVRVGQVGAGTVGETGGQVAAAARIESPYLQLVMSRLWDEERAAGSDVLRLATFERLGGAGQIVGSHLDNAMSALSDADRDVAARVLRFLVTPDGTKIAHTAGDLAEFAEVPREQLDRVLDHLASGSTLILRREAAPGPGARVRYELFHDVLGPAILDWQARYREARRRDQAQARLEAELAEAERQRREAQTKERAARRRTVGLAVVAVAFAVLAVGVFAFSRVAEANRFTAQARSDAVNDPDSAVQDALTSLGTWGTPEAEDALRIAMSHTHTAAVQHDDVVWSAAFAPDGARFVTASEDGTARIVDTESGETLHTLAAHGDAVVGAAFSPDGSLVVTTSRDQTARVWDAESGSEHFVLTHDAPVYLASSDLVAPDGAYIATGAFNADGTRLVTFAGSAARVWDLETGEEVVPPLDHPDLSVYSAAFSPDGTLIATGANDGQARIWDAATGEPVLDPLDNVTSWVNAVVFSPDGRFIATANSDGSVGLWEVETGFIAQFLLPHTDAVSGVSFSVDGSRLLSAGDRTAWIYDVSQIPDDVSGEYEIPALVAVDPKASWTDGARFTADGRYVVTAHQDATARVVDAETGDELLALRGHDNVVWTAAFSPDGRRVLTASEDGSARVLAVGAELELRGHTLGVSSAAIGPDGRVLTASVDRTATVWDQEGNQLTELVGENPQDADPPEYGSWPMSSAEFSSDGTRIVTAQTGPELGVAIWDPAAPDEPLARCCANAFREAWGAAFYPDSHERLLVVYDDQTLRIWDLADDPDGTELYAFMKLGIIGAAISEDGRTILTVGRDDKMARTWDAATFEERRAWPVGLVASLALSPDGTRLVTGGFDHTLRIWDVESGEEPILELAGPTAAVTAVNFSPNGAWVLAGDSAGSTWIWDASSGRLLGVMHLHGDGINAVVVADDGRIITASEDGTAKISRCDVCGPIDAIVERARALSVRPAPSPSR